MAYAALILFYQTLEKILNPHPQIKSLMEKVCHLLDFLEDSSENYNSMSMNDLEGQMRDAACEGEDIIESHLFRQILPKSNSSFWERFCDGIQNLLPAFHRYEIVDNDLELEIKHLQNIIEEFEFILDWVSKIKDGKVAEPLQPTRKSLLSGASGPSRISSSKKGAMVGLDGDFIQIKDQLTGSSSHLDIISIVGMGGIGKTTLARNLYNDSYIDYHFDIRAWATVSQDYHWHQTLRDLLNSIKHVNSKSEHMIVDNIEENLYKTLKDRRYLIVLDDLWDTKACDDVKRLFPDDNNGSRIILTTRISEVALYDNSSSTLHQMSLLDLDKSWNLLRAKVFGEECCPPEFEEIGRNIARNCQGLPLAIVLIGGVLSKGSRTRDYWEYIERNVMSAVTGNEGQLMDILSLSYNNLPHHLKACFLYMGVFPEDHEILASRLIKLWVAEGFLKPHYSKKLEEVAEECLNDLIGRNLIMVRQRNHHGGIKTCIIHDLLRDLCVKKARDEWFLLVLNRNSRDLPEVGYNEYRISIHSHILRTGMHESRVRSFLYFTENDSKNLSLSFVRFKLLKVLDALGITFYEFPSEVLELINLRYLALLIRGSIFKNELPAAIVKLKNLQTLTLSSDKYGIDDKPCHLPSEIWEMPQLRHLSFNQGLLPYPSGARLHRENCFDMANLYTLSGVQNFVCRKEVFEIMPNLKKLRISYTIDKSTKRSSYDFSSFFYARKLESLKLSFDDNRRWKNSAMNFGFPLKLRKLSLSGCRISWNHMKVVGSLPNLQVLKLKNSSFDVPVWEPNEEEFLELNYLLLERIDLNQWNANETHFPNLQHLSLYYCFLEEIPSAIGDISTLQKLEVFNCSDSVMESAKLIEEQQQSLGNDSLKVHITFRNFFRPL